MRVYTERCLRNLQDRMIVCGFEGWDIFIVVGAALILQMVKVNNLLIWVIAGGLSAFLILIKKGKPANATEHYLDWFFKEKQFTAFPQTIIHSIRGRSFDIKLNPLQSLLPYSHFEDGLLVFKDDSISAGYEIACPGIDSLSQEELIGYSQKMETFINGLPERTTYQIFFTLDSNFQKEINEHKNIKTKHPLIKAMHAQRIAKFEEITGGKLFRRRRCFLFVNFAYLRPEQKKVNFLSDRKKFTEQDIESFKHEFRLIRNNIA